MRIKHKKRVPFVEQLVPTECGVCCATMILQYYYNKEGINDIRKALEVGRDGLKLIKLKNFLQTKGFEIKVYQAKTDMLCQVLLPAIVFWKDKHYIILEKIRNKKYCVVDPAIGRICLSYEEFNESYSNIVMTVVPTDSFRPVTIKKNLWKDVLLNFRHKKSLFVKIALISAITYLIQILSPILVQEAIDIILKKKNDSLLIYYFLATVGLVLAVGCSTFFRKKKLIDLQICLDEDLSSRTFSKLLRLPYKYYELHTNGDLLFRMNSLTLIRDLLSEHVIDGMLQIGMVLVIGSYMFSRSVFLALIAIVLFMINGFFIVLMRPKILEANQRQINENTKVQSVQVETIQTIFGIKAAGLENEVLDNWEEKYEKSMEVYKDKGNLLNIYTTFVSVFQIIAPFLLLIIGIVECMKGRMLVGELVAFYSLSTTFFGVTISIFNMWNDFFLASSYMERINDIIDGEEEKNPEKPIELRLNGSILMENISFSYTSSSERTLKNINLRIDTGEKVAIVGESGSGKSTLMKVLLGLYEPTDGKIYYDGVSLDDLNKTELRKQLGIVPQDMTLFNKTILENIRMNKNVAFEEVQRAAQIAQIDEEIEAMPMKYHTLVSEMGMNLSGGQRQRIVLARALLNDPKLLVLDEATSSLDTINEAKVSQYLKTKGNTRVIIAHRLSTIIDADKIVVLKDGEIAECGTHEELMKKSGTYKMLYKNSQKVDEKENSIC